MEYREYLSSLDVNAQFQISGDLRFDTGMYKNENNFDYVLTISGQSSANFEELCKILNINQKHDFSGAQYISRVPIQVKIEEGYFKGRREEVVQMTEFVNNFLTVYEYFRNQFGMPRFVLDGREIYKNADGKWLQLPYDSLFNNDFYDVIKESIIHGEGSTDLISLVAADKEPFDIGWKLYLEALRHFYAGDFRQAVMNCVTAVESEVTHPVESWITQSTFTKDESHGKTAIRELGNPLKFEIYIASVNPTAFSPRYNSDELTSLVQNFKKMNSIRNKIVHEGLITTLSDTKMSIETSGLFLRALWMQRHGM
jgi:hypothetical protein